MNAVKAIPAPDRKALDKYGNPTRWILKAVEPPELRGLILFPQGFVVEPGKKYVVDIVRHGKNFAVVKLHEHIWNEERRDEDPYIVKIVMRCKTCGAFNVLRFEKYRAPLVDDWKSRWYVQYAVELRRLGGGGQKRAAAEVLLRRRAWK